MRDDERALALLQQFGRIGTAFQVLSPGLLHWFDDAPGMVAYIDTGGAWVAAGEPICASAHAADVAHRFVLAAQSRGRRASFFGTEGILASSPRFERIQLGEQPVWDPQAWSSHVQSHRSLREQLRRARAKGVTVRRVMPEELARDQVLRAQLDSVVTLWLASRPMPAMHFLVEVAPLSMLLHRRLFVAQRRGDAVGLLSVAPVPARNGWLFEHLLRDPSAPNGTSESLVDAAMRALAAENVSWVTLGLAPLAGEVAPWLERVRSASRPLFNFNGLASFKRKLRPQAWSPIYLAHPSGSSSFAALLDGLRAFAGGSLWRFAFHTILRGPRPLLVALERLLIPWTLLLTLASSARWFPSAAVKWSWVAFDVALYALLRTARKRNWLLGIRAAAVAVSLDAVLTLWQALMWNAPRSGGWRDATIIAIACAAPLITAPTLWGASRRLAKVRDTRRSSNAR